MHSAGPLRKQPFSWSYWGRGCFSICPLNFFFKTWFHFFGMGHQGQVYADPVLHSPLTLGGFPSSLLHPSVPDFFPTLGPTLLRLCMFHQPCAFPHLWVDRTWLVSFTAARFPVPTGNWAVELKGYTLHPLAPISLYFFTPQRQKWGFALPFSVWGTGFLRLPIHDGIPQLLQDQPVLRSFPLFEWRSASFQQMAFFPPDQLGFLRRIHFIFYGVPILSGSKGAILIDP